MSKPQPQPLIQLPALFSTVEPGVFRSASPNPAQVPFLASLGLKTVVSLTAEHPIKPLLQFVRDNGVDFVHLGLTQWRRPGTDWKPVRYEIIKTALESYVLDVRAHPVLIIDPLGVHQTGCLVGSLRMMQGWNFASALVEYRAHAGSKHRYVDEQYIELFDPDLINLPQPQYRPSWWSSLYDQHPETVNLWASKPELYQKPEGQKQIEEQGGSSEEVAETMPQVAVNG
ncbi:hypothetical protein L202_04767 [Cryptococcus amylolentus CBS 6039]|uniref:Protein-tyrosine-phosphatase n=2 Tax=Cryptococcus amylolentus TaxID=104669 RepID=A0A1E3HMN0_9TREE|nr:hypothetical protein L202_04767 [Cryptococcus amylolentus CBS 6039]ODN77600.1 hypothetical protein L202_04767 [Cryptococcus amylolentus CBS 6039]ODO05634.1 hypothetical protein I350_04693 [Cryptococcus amylolentus CBS 6273]